MLYVENIYGLCGFFFINNNRLIDYSDLKINKFTLHSLFVAVYIQHMQR